MPASSAARVVPFTSQSSPDDLHTLWEATIGASHPPYSIPAPKFRKLLTADNAKVFVAFPPHRSVSDSDSQGVSASSAARDRSGEPPLGFAITYLIKQTSSANPDTTLRGSLAALVVSPSHQKKGVGSALHDAAVAYLEGAVRTSLPAGKEGSLQLGSTFPRIFPGLPDVAALQPAKEWFHRRGWAIAAPDAIDLYSPLPNKVDLDQFIVDAEKRGTTFRQACSSDRDELLRMEFAEFDSFTVGLLPWAPERSLYHINLR